MEKIKVIIVDDDNFVREGMQIILNADPEFEVLGCAANGKDALEIIKEKKADIILMDIQMPEMDGIEATKEIVDNNLGTVLILTTFDDYELVNQALKNGAKGYLIKNHTPDQLKQTIKAVISGVDIVDKKVVEKMDAASTKSAQSFSKELYTERELDIIQLIAEGMSNKEIAAKLYLSEGTVKNYISGILEKENLEHRTKLAVYYLTGKK